MNPWDLFESDVIFDSGQTGLGKPKKIYVFESDVIFDSGQAKMRTRSAHLV